MDSYGQLNTPVALLIFNRPDTTEKVFEEIRRARPVKLLIVADGPRRDHPGDLEKCAEARRIVERVDWSCQVIRNYAETNLGCGVRPATGISWVFEEVEEAIILEDDCLPHPTFFRYCQELLERYRHDERVMAISGCKFGQKRSRYSYYFSMFPQSTGWASWRRAWQYYDFAISSLPEALEGGWLKKILTHDGAIRYWTARFKEVYGPDKRHIWDFQWTFACWVQSGLSITPEVNLITNIGYGPEATHTKNADDSLANLRLEEMRFPLQHPPFIFQDKIADNEDLKIIYNLTFRIRLFLLIKYCFLATCRYLNVKR